MIARSCSRLQQCSSLKEENPEDEVNDMALPKLLLCQTYITIDG